MKLLTMSDFPPNLHTFILQVGAVGEEAAHLNNFFPTEVSALDQYMGGYNPCSRWSTLGRFHPRPSFPPA